MMNKIMKFEPRLVIIPYPNRDSPKAGSPFMNACFMLSSSYWCQIYIDKLYIPEGKSTTVKIFGGQIFVDHNMPLAAFNSKKFSQVAYELEAVVCAFII